MRALRGVAGALLWVVAALVGLVGALACVTVVLLPVGIPLLFLARKLFTRAVQLLMPPKVAHPIRHAAGAGADVTKKARKKLRKAGKASRRQGRKLRLT